MTSKLRTCYTVVTCSLDIERRQVETLASLGVAEQFFADGEYKMRVEFLRRVLSETHEDRADTSSRAHGRGVDVQQAVFLKLLPNKQFCNYVINNIILTVCVGKCV